MFLWLERLKIKRPSLQDCSGWITQIQVMKKTENNFSKGAMRKRDLKGRDDQNVF